MLEIDIGVWGISSVTKRRNTACVTFMKFGDFPPSYGMGRFFGRSLINVRIFNSHRLPIASGIERDAIANAGGRYSDVLN